MQDVTPNRTMTHSFERFLAITGTIVCIIISARIWQVLSPGQPMWPLPNGYLLEMILVSIIGMFGILENDSKQTVLKEWLTWTTVGILSAFAVMGAWSIGFFFIPVALIFLAAALLAGRRRHRNLATHLGMGFLAAILQIVLMLAIIRLE